MKQPKLARPYSGRQLDCEYEMQPYFDALVKYAVDNGWSQAEAVNALINLGESQKIAEANNDLVSLPVLKTFKKPATH